MLGVEPERIELEKHSHGDKGVWPAVETIDLKQPFRNLDRVEIQSGSNAKVDFSGGTIVDSVLVVGDNGQGVIWPTPIPVSERLPEDHDTMVLAFDGECWYMVVWIGDRWTDDDPDMRLEYEQGNFTHWLPLPPKPE